MLTYAATGELPSTQVRLRAWASWSPRSEKSELAHPAPGELIYALGMVISTVCFSFCTCFHRLIRSKVYPTGDPVGTWKRSSRQRGRCGIELNKAVRGWKRRRRAELKLRTHPEFGRNVQDLAGHEDSSAA